MEWAEQGARLQQLREAKGISRHRLGVLVDRVAQTVLNWEQGKIRPSIEMVIQVGDVLDAKAELLELYGYTGEPGMAERLAEVERRLDEQQAVIERLVGLLGLAVDVSAAQAAKPQKRPPKS